MGAEHNLFGRYVSDVSTLLQTMKITDSVAVGGAVLSGFDPRFQLPSEYLDIIPSCSDSNQALKFQDT